VKSNEDVVKACVTEAKHLLESKIPFKAAVDGAIELHKPMTKPEEDELRSKVVDILNHEKFDAIIERSRGRTYATKIVKDEGGRTTLVGQITRKSRLSGRDLASGAGAEERRDEIQMGFDNPGAA
jgi:hypothetical protein